MLTRKQKWRRCNTSNLNYIINDSKINKFNFIQEVEEKTNNKKAVNFDNQIKVMGHLQDIASPTEVKDYFATINSENELSFKENESEIQSDQESEFSDDDEDIQTGGNVSNYII